VRALDTKASRSSVPIRSTRSQLAASAAFAVILAGSLRAAPTRAYLPSTGHHTIEESRMRTLQSLGVVSSIAIASAATAQNAVQWRVEDGGNGHWYEAVVLPGGGLNWEQARSVVQALGADLASLETAAEWGFAGPLVDTSRFDGAWIGLYQTPSACEPGCGWSWVSGSTLSDQNWFPGEPNNAGGSFGDEDHALIAGIGWGCGPACWGKWVDWPGATALKAPVALVEWSADCNNDGLVDYGQIRSGLLLDADGDNIPDACEGTGSFPSVRQWRISDGGNGHWYSVVVRSNFSWSQCRAEAQASGGELASITTSQEQAFVRTLAFESPAAFVGDYGPFIGGFQDLGAADYFEPGGGWRWSDGEPWSFQAWSLIGEPNNCLSACTGCAAENCIQLYGPQYNGAWNDMSHVPLPCSGQWLSKGYVAEWSADCNNDGFVDFGQIIGGSLVDLDHNFVPDVCETTLHVPGEYPSIQAAIDAVPADAHRVIFVAAGVYHESFRLNGKSVVVRGAANGATILDGTGLTSSIVQMFDYEPATAGLESLVFRNAISGSHLLSEPSIMVGGAIYMNHSDAFIRDCRFEGCRADFGGAVYHQFGRLAWDNCVFVGNTANNEGGAALIYNTTGAATGCTFSGNRSGIVGQGGGSALQVVGSNGDGETVLLDSCMFTANVAGDSGGAIKIYEHVKFQPVVLRLVDTIVTGNLSGEPLPSGAAGITNLGRQQCCVLAGNTSVCLNTPSNIDGPFLLEGPAEACGCFADITGDGSVNGADLAVVLTSWGIAETTGMGDVNHDGLVNGADLSSVLGAWGSCP